MSLPHLSGQDSPDTQKSILLYTGIRTGTEIKPAKKKDVEPELLL
jgi:hypothetical protein